MSMDVFGGILAGLGQAQHEQNQNLIQQEMQRRQFLGNYYLREADNPANLPEAQDLYRQKGLGIFQADPYKRLPKNLESLDDIARLHVNLGSPGWLGGQTTRTVSAQPMSIPTSLDGGQATAPPAEEYTVPQPSPPPGYTRSPRYTPQELAQMQAYATGLTAEAQARAKTAAEIDEIGQRADAIRSRFPDMPERDVAAMATGHPLPPQTSFNVPGSISAAEAAKRAVGGTDFYGQPIDPNNTDERYVQRMVHDKMFMYPTGVKIRQMQYAMRQADGHWMEYATDEYGGYHPYRDLGLIPPAGVPTTSINYGVRIVKNKDNSESVIPVTTLDQHYRELGETIPVPGPTAPPIGGAGPPAATTPAATAPALGTVQPGPGQLPGPSPTGAPPAPAPAPGPLPTGAPPTAAPRPTGRPQARIGAPILIPGAGQGLTELQGTDLEKEAGAYDFTLEQMNTVLGLARNPDFHFDDFLHRAKLMFYTNPASGLTATIVSNIDDLQKDKDHPLDAKFAAAYNSLAENINILRGPYKANVSRGQEMLHILQSQRGELRANPEVFRQTLMNSMESALSQLTVLHLGLIRSGRDMGPPSDNVVGAYMNLYGPKAKEVMRTRGWIK